MNFRLLCALCFALPPGFLGVVSADQASQIELSDAQVLDWQGVRQQTSLTDGSILNEYLGQTFATNQAGSSLQVAFVPRFNCTPAISILLGGQLATMFGEDDAALQRIAIEIDQSAVDYPLLFDEDGQVARLSYNGNDQARESLRKLIALGDRLSVIVQNGDPDRDSRDFKFSLRGSSRSLLAAEDHCRSHEPIPFDK